MLDNKLFYTLLVTFFLVLTTVIVDNVLLSYIIPIIYLVQIVTFGLVFFKSRNNRYYIFSPTFLTLLYLNLNFIVGHITVSTGLGFDLKYYNAFMRYESLTFITVYLIICNMIVFTSLQFTRINRLPYTFESNDIKVPKFLIPLLLIVLFVLGFVQVDLSFIGGGGDFSYVYKLLCACFIVFILSYKKKKSRFFIYPLIIVFFIIGSYSSKREILYVIILIIFLEIMRNRSNLKINLKYLFYGFLGFCGFIYIVLVSSIMRGYGSYEPENIVEASSYINDYVTSDIFLDALTANFETNAVYGNSTNAINYVYSNQVELTYGSTFLKFLFIPFPRQIFPDKPDSMIDIYTRKFMPEFRAIGGSYPIIIYSEVFWNFHILGFVFLFFLFKILNKLYVKLLININNNIMNVGTIFLLFMYITFIQFVRGSGLEIWLLYGVLTLPLAFIINFLIKYFR